MSDKALEKRNEQSPTVETQADNEVVFTPGIDIREGDDSITLIVDMPGTDGSSVDVTVEKNTLTIEGTPSLEVPEGYELVNREYNIGKYRRDFTLSNDVDTDKITAKSSNRVLTVVIPKREERKARKIKIA
jgi:HSP20 family molecular chaperone IbpA